MRQLLFLTAILAGTGLAGTPAAAIEYPWCANFADGAGANCGFTSYEQCMLTARGTGGYCAENSFYQRPAASARPAKRDRPPPKKE
jgi:hypothetical protein